MIAFGLTFSQTLRLTSKFSSYAVSGSHQHPGRGTECFLHSTYSPTVDLPLDKARKENRGPSGSHMFYPEEVLVTAPDSLDSTHYVAVFNFSEFCFVSTWFCLCRWLVGPLNDSVHP